MGHITLTGAASEQAPAVRDALLGP
jgi:hypothetical protein